MSFVKTIILATKLFGGALRCMFAVPKTNTNWPVFMYFLAKFKVIYY